MTWGDLHNSEWAGPTPPQKEHPASTGTLLAISRWAHLSSSKIITFTFNTSVKKMKALSWGGSRRADTVWNCHCQCLSCSIWLWSNKMLLTLGSRIVVVWSYKLHLVIIMETDLFLLFFHKNTIIFFLHILMIAVCFPNCPPLLVPPLFYCHREKWGNVCVFMAVIFDQILSGFPRTGPGWARERAGRLPPLLCARLNSGILDKPVTLIS